MLDTDNDQQENKTEQSTPPKALPSEDHSNQIVNELTNLAVQMTEAQGKIKKLKGDRKQYSFIALALILADIAIGPCPQRGNHLRAFMCEMVDVVLGKLSGCLTPNTRMIPFRV